MLLQVLNPEYGPLSPSAETVGEVGTVHLMWDLIRYSTWELSQRYTYSIIAYLQPGGEKETGSHSPSVNVANGIFRQLLPWVRGSKEILQEVDPHLYPMI